MSTVYLPSSLDVLKLNGMRMKFLKLWFNPNINIVLRFESSREKLEFVLRIQSDGTIIIDHVNEVAQHG